MDKPALLLTRPRDSAERFVAELDPASIAGLTICISPLLEIVSTGVAPAVGNDEGVIFSSAQAVGFGPDGHGRPAFCVGATTAQDAAAKGWAVQLVRQTADGLVEALGQTDKVPPLVHMAGVHRRGEIAERLQATGMAVRVVTLYEQRLVPLSRDAKNLLAGKRRVIAPLFSPRTALQFARQAPDMRHVTIVAISPAVAEVLERHIVHQVRIASAPSGREMLRSVEMLLHQDSLP